jgi:hypothetical protein
VTNYGEREHHDLSLSGLQELLLQEWKREFNGLIIDRDEEGVGRLYAFFSGELAYVAYEDLDNEQWRCSYDLDECKRTGWDELVRLTPDDTQDYAFRKCSLISKDRAMRIVNDYVASGNVVNLYLMGPTGQPVGLE